MAFKYVKFAYRRGTCTSLIAVTLKTLTYRQYTPLDIQRRQFREILHKIMTTITFVTLHYYCTVQI